MRKVIRIFTTAIILTALVFVLAACTDALAVETAPATVSVTDLSETDTSVNEPDVADTVVEYPDVIYTNGHTPLFKAKCAPPSTYVEVNTPLRFVSINGNYVTVDYKNALYIVYASSISTEPLIEYGYITDESVTDWELNIINSNLMAYFPTIENTWEHYCRSDWDLVFTKKPLAQYFEDEELDLSGTARNGNPVVGKWVRQGGINTIYVTITSYSYVHYATLHEIGHYVYYMIMTEKERTAWCNVYSEQMGDNYQLLKSVYGSYHISTPSELFAESFKLVTIGTTNGTLDEENIPEGIVEFILPYVN